MIGQIVQIVVALVLAVGAAWLALRAWRSRRGALVRWPGSILAGLLTLVLGLIVIVSSIGFSKVHAKHDNPIQNVQVASSADQIARGERMAHLCQGCHSVSSNLPLNGGDENFGGPFGTLYPPNLTPGGPLRDWSDGEVIRAIRQGIHKDGRALVVMPAVA
jgi:hypothetical protein